MKLILILFRYVAQQASIPRELNTKFLESIQPFVTNQAVEQSISEHRC